MKILLGVSRYLVTDAGTMMLQKSEDQLEIEVPDNGSEFLRSIWMMDLATGEELLQLPLSMAPTVQKYTGGE